MAPSSPAGREGHSPAVPSPLNPRHLAITPPRPLPRSGRPARKATTPLSPTQRLLRKKAQVAWRSEVLRRAVGGGPQEISDLLLYSDRQEVDEFGLDLESNEKSSLLETDEHPIRSDTSTKTAQSGLAKARRRQFWRSRRVIACTVLVCILLFVPCLRFHPSLRRHFDT